MLIDTHCHLDFPQFSLDRDAVIKRAGQDQIGYIINVGSSIESSFRSRELADKYENIFFSFGCHPHDAEEFNKSFCDSSIDFLIEKFKDLTSHEKLVAIGEVGLDYFKSQTPKEIQKKVFIQFIEIARKLNPAFHNKEMDFMKGGVNLPLIIHCRESQEDLFDILKDKIGDFKKVVFHCFSGPREFLVKCLALGAMFSFTANITYPKAGDLRELIKVIPLERVMLETDAPYLSPQKFRGKRNEPSYIHLTAQELALIKNVTFDDVAKITTQNARIFFNLG